MSMTPLKQPLASYPARFNRFLWLLVSVKGLKPQGRHLWKVMDGPAFQDAETALEVELLNEGRPLGEETVRSQSLTIRKDDRRRSTARAAKTAND
jgi:hypothetical protein